MQGTDYFSRRIVFNIINFNVQMSKALAIVILVLLLESEKLMSQQSCDCEWLANKERFLNEAIEQQNENILKEILTSNSLQTPFCKQTFYYWKSLFYFKTNKIDSLGFYLNLMQKELQIQSCEANLIKYNYLKGYFYVKNEQYDSASKYFLNAIEKARTTNNIEFLAKSNIGIGLVFDRIMQPQKSISYYKEAILLADQIKEDKIKLTGLVNLQSSFGMCYDENEEIKYLDSVKSYCFQTLKLAKELNAKKEIIRTYVTLAGSFLSEKKYTKALQYCDSVILLADLNHNKSQLHSVYFKMAQCYIELKEFGKAISAAKLSLQFADNNAKKANAIYRLFEANKLQGNFEKALQYHEQLKTLDEEVLRNDRLKAVTELEQKYEKSKNEKTIKELNQASEIKTLRIRVLLFGIVLALFIILIVFFAFRQKAMKSKQLFLEIEQRLNRSRMNPHFFFNALTTLQGLAVKEYDGKQMAIHLYKFSSLMRKTLESSFNDYVTIDDELNFINHYIELQQLKQKDKFEFYVEVSPEIESAELLVPTMLIQPFLENAIEHGFASIHYLGKIQLSIHSTASALHIVISDNGQGFVETNKSHSKHISRAIQITKDRLYLLSKVSKQESYYFIKNKESLGVEIELVLPLLYERPGISH